MRGFFAIGIYQSKSPDNLGTLWRSAYNFGAAYIFTVGRRYDRQPSDTVRASDHIPLCHFADFDAFNEHRPHGARLIGVEQAEEAVSLAGFCHPPQGVYILGAEDRGLPRDILVRCQHVVHIDTRMCINVAVAGSIVMYDRVAKMGGLAAQSRALGVTA